MTMIRMASAQLSPAGSWESPQCAAYVGATRRRIRALAKSAVRLWPAARSGADSSRSDGASGYQTRSKQKGPVGSRSAMILNGSRGALGGARRSLLGAYPGRTIDGGGPAYAPVVSLAPHRSAAP